MKQIIFFLTIAAGGLFLFSGCNNDTRTLSGTVTYSDDGSPVTCGMIYFDSASSRSKAAIRNDGTFKAGTMKDADGIKPGVYRVSIVGAEKPGTGKSEDPMIPPPAEPLIDKKYENADTSGLTLTVNNTTKTFDIKVERPKAAK